MLFGFGIGAGIVCCVRVVFDLGVGCVFGVGVGAGIVFVVCLLFVVWLLVWCLVLGSVWVMVMFWCWFSVGFRCWC